MGFNDEEEPPPSPAERTASSINERLDDLGWNQFDLVRESGVSATTIRWLQTGVERDYRPGTLAKISKAVGWPAGAIRQMLRGEQAPEPITDPRPGAVETTSMPTLDQRISRLEQAVDQLQEAMQDRGILPGSP